MSLSVWFASLCRFYVLGKIQYHRLSLFCQDTSYIILFSNPGKEEDSLPSSSGRKYEDYFLMAMLCVTNCRVN